MPPHHRPTLASISECDDQPWTGRIGNSGYGAAVVNSDTALPSSVSGPTLTVCEIDLKIGHSPVCLQLTQLRVPLDASSRPAPDVREDVRHAFELAEREQCAAGVTVFPEVSVPRASIEDALEAHRRIGRPHISVLGVEFISSAEALELLGSLGSALKHAERTITTIRESPGNLVNLTLLLVTESSGQVAMIPQLKLAPSADELTPYTERSLVRGQELVILKGTDFSLAAITCSDFFSRSPQAEKRYLDFLEYSHVRSTTPGDALDILVNHQYNRSPDHQYFAEGLGRLYGDRDFAKRLIVLVSNAMDENTNVPGSSRAFFHRSVPLRHTKAIREASIPVTGYELLGGPGSLFINLETPPKYWPERDAPVMCHVDGGPADGLVRTLVPPVTRSPIKFSSRAELIRRLSELGDYDGAERQAREALRYLDAPRRDLPLEASSDLSLQRAQFHLSIAQQHRNRGFYDACLTELAHAETRLGEVPEDRRNVSHQLASQRIRFNRIFAETLQGQGLCGLALAQLVALASSIEEAAEAASGEDAALLMTQAANASRQCADLYLLTGAYGQALETHVATEYEWYQVREIAYSRRGQADAHRMLGEFDQARNGYDQLIKYCDANADSRLWNRTMIGRLECDRARWLLRAEPADQPPDEVRINLDALARTSAESSFLVGTVYVQIVEASLLTAQDPEAALRLLESLRNRWSTPTGANSRAIEAMHLELAIAEALRAGQRYPEAASVYRRCLARYARSGMPWGTVRSWIGLQLVSDDDSPQPAETDGYLTRLQERGRIGDDTVLLANIPLVP